MKGFCGFIAVMGIIAAMCGQVTELSGLITIAAIIVYAFYPGDENPDRYNEDKQ